MNTFSLQDRMFLVTGGTRGIGRAISLHFARCGALVIANYVRNQAAAEDLAATAGKEGLRLLLCRADLTHDKGLSAIAEVLACQGGNLSGLVHCAATGVHAATDTLTLRQLDFTMALNFRAFFALVAAVRGNLTDGGRIVAVSSAGATRAVPSYAAVGASKGALEAMVRHLAAELAPQGICVNLLTPGSVRTEAWEAMPDSEGRLQETVRRTPAGRLVTLEEVAHATHFLCSDAASGVVGQTLVVDGGHRIVE